MLKKQLWRYWLAMNAAAFDTAIHAGAAFLGVAGAHALSDAIPALSPQQFAAVFLTAFGRAVLKYLDDHPPAEWVLSANRESQTGGRAPKPGTLP